jgi:hypothetical protein
MRNNFTSIGDSAMNKHQQERFPRLAIVGQTDRKPRKQAAGLPWWGPQRSRNFSLKQATQTTQVPCHEIRMAVMPTLSRNLLFTSIAWIWNFLRAYFVSGAEHKRGADVLSFRRPAGLAPRFRRGMVEESFPGKKPNGNVRWQSACEVAPQEGGRR